MINAPRAEGPATGGWDYGEDQPMTGTPFTHPIRLLQQGDHPLPGSEADHVCPACPFISDSPVEWNP
ncbi:MAG TPA: hypothetical protein VIH59_00200, partial [Candidatus Tectomicrobia bacterium]